MAAPVAKGSFTPVVGLGGMLFTGCIVEDAELDDLAEMEPLKNEDSETVCRIYSDPGVGGRMNMLVGLAGLAAVNAARKGDTLTLDAVDYYIDDIKRIRGRGTMKAQIAFSVRESESPA